MLIENRKSGFPF